MKKLKSILALIIVMVILCVSVSSVLATSEVDIELDEIMWKLQELCEEAHFAYGVGYSITDPPRPGSQNKPKYLACSDTTELKRAWQDACAMVEGYYRAHISLYDGEISVLTAAEKYHALYEELYKIVIDRSELETLVAFCEKENNDNSYYEVKLWNDFQTEIAQAKQLLADNTISDMRVNTAYYELMYSLNLICTSNQVAGDVDNDKEMSVLDATYIQLYLAGYETINFSQMLVTGAQRTDDLSVLSATAIQRKCAKVTDMYEPVVLERMIRDLDKSNPYSVEFELSSWRNNFIFYSEIILGTKTNT